MAKLLSSKTFLAFSEAKAYFGIEGRTNSTSVYYYIIPVAWGLGDILQVHPHTQLTITSWTLNADPG